MLALGVLAALAAAPGAQAKGSAPAERSPAEVRAYWTAERMRDAVPAERLLAGVEAPAASLPARESGAPSVVAPADPTRPLARGLLAGGGGDGEAIEISNPRPAPYRTHGKVFMTLDDGVILTPDDYVCSATVVTSEIKRLVVTAGHCVYGFGRFATNWMFVPAYDEGARPFGSWVAADLATTRQWRESEDIRYDVGMAKMARRSGRPIQKVVGARGIGFNLDPNRYHAYGYPAGSPYNGKELRMCNSRARGSDQSEGNPQPRRIRCDMTGGSSGGGWVVREKLVNSVVSYGYECTIPVFPCENPERGNLFGPYFGETIKRLYRSQQRRLR